MAQIHAPCDPNCPEYAEFIEALMGDEMTHAMGAPVDEIVEAFEKRHRKDCLRCVKYGVAHIEFLYL